MKRLALSILIVCTIASAVHALKFVFPKPQGYVSDYAQILDRSTQLQIENLGRALENTTGVEMAVVIVKNTLPYNHLEYSNKLFNYWQIGKKGKDNGILLLLTLKEKKIHIETGYGIEGIIPDGKAGEIIDQFILPKFKEGKYAEGLYNGSLAIAQTIGNEYQVQITGTYYEIPESQEKTPDILSIMFIIVIMLFIFSGRFGLWPLILFGDRPFHSSNTFSGFGGGFGGFGGGFSGGGGASRGW